MEREFWEMSWRAVNEGRVTEYTEREEGDDPIWKALRGRNVRTVCDAGCGCGAYTRKLARQGYAVKGFDLSARAVEIAWKLLKHAGLTAELKTAGVLETGYADGEFDAVICRDVLDHMPKRDAARAIVELYRITKPGGMVLLTLDGLDDDYQREPHRVTAEGDYRFTDGKWKGMVFHPYGEEEAAELVKGVGPSHVERLADGLLVRLEK